MKRESIFKRSLMQILSVSILFMSLVACEREGAEYVEDLDIVVTTPDNEFKFEELVYYSMPDTVLLISANPDSVPKKSEYSKLILDKVRENFKELGYVEVEPKSELVDVAVTVSALETRYVGYYPWSYWNYLDYWYWYWNPYYPGYWNPYYPYPAPGTVYSYDVGTVIIDMMDVNSASIDGMPIVWEASINGLLTDSSENMENRISTYIDQAFIQSPYFVVIAE